VTNPLELFRRRLPRPLLRLLSPIATLAFVAWAGASAWAGNTTWTGATSTDWNTASNWSAGVPGANDVATIPVVVSGRYPSLTANGKASQIFVNAGATVTVQNGITLQLGGNTQPTITGPGSILTVGTGFIEINQNGNGTFVFSPTASITLGNLRLKCNGSGNQCQIPDGFTLTVNGDFEDQIGKLAVGDNTTHAAVKVFINGNTSLYAQGDIDMTITNNCELHLRGNYTESGKRFESGTTSTVFWDGGGNQNIGSTDPQTGDSDYANLVVGGGARTVTFLENPNTVYGFNVLKSLTVGPNVNFIVQEACNNAVNQGIGTVAADVFRIDNGATVTFKENFNPSCTISFTDAGGAASTGTLRIEGTITADTSVFGWGLNAGVGTIVYAGQLVNQTVYTSTNTTTPVALSYYNLTIDNLAGRIATQQAPNLLRVNGSFTVNTANSTFTATAGNMAVKQNFVDNGTFNQGTFRVTLDGTGSISGTAASLTFYQLFVSGALTTDVRTAARSFTVNNTFQVTNATLTTSGVLATPITMTALQGLTVGDGAGAAGSAQFLFVGPDTLAIADGMPFSVNAVDGLFTTRANGGVPSQANNPNLTHQSGTFIANVNGQVDLWGLNFSFGRDAGLNINTSAALAPATPASFVIRLRDVRFTNVYAGAGSRHLTIIAPGLDLDCPGCFFDTVAPPASYNVRALTADQPLALQAFMRLRFEDRRLTSTSLRGPGAGDTNDLDDDKGIGADVVGVTSYPHANNGKIDSDEPSNGSIVQWVYTANIDVPGQIQGFPAPAFDWTTFIPYSSYVLMKNASGSNDAIYVLNSNGDLKTYSFMLTTGAHIVGPVLWDSTGGLHVVYFGTTDGRVYQLIDDGASLKQPTSGAWSTAFNDGLSHSDATLAEVTSAIITDGTNLYFAGRNTSTGNGVYRIVIASKSMPVVPVSTAGGRVTTAPSWGDTWSGRMLFFGDPGGNLFRVSATTWGSVNASYNMSGKSFEAYINAGVAYVYEGDTGGNLHQLNGFQTPATYTTRNAGFPFATPSGSPIRGGAVVDFEKDRIFFGNDAGELYTVGPYTGLPWAPGSNYWIFNTGAAIRSMPLYQTYGIVYVGNAAGQLFIIDVNNGGGGQSLVRTYTFTSGVALGDISRDPRTKLIYVATAGGKLYAIAPVSDPSSGAE
jgi:hypothetical protein